MEIFHQPSLLAEPGGVKKEKKDISSLPCGEKSARAKGNREREGRDGC